MSELIIILGAILGVIGILLFQISLKYRTWVTTLTIIVSLTISIVASAKIYTKIGYPQEIHLFQEKWMLHYYTSSDEDQTFYIMIQEAKDRPKLVAYRIANKDNYNKQKEGLKKAMKSGGDGSPMMGEFNTETEEFVFHAYNISEVYKK